MKSVGVFLGVDPSAGGMFQYCRSVLEGLRGAHAAGCRVEVAYVEPLWEPILADFPFRAARLQGGRLGLKMASALMAMRLGLGATRLLTRRLNPIARQLRRLGCELWIFPSQDALGYQLDMPVVSSIHDLMHRYEPQFPEVAQAGRFRIREHRFGHLARSARAVLVDSAMGRRHVVESYGVAPDKVFPLPYVAPEYIFAPEPPDFEARYPLPPKFLFYPAQFWPHKNHARLLEAAAIARARCPDIHLVFSGGQRHAFEDVRAQAARLGLASRVSFPGYVPDAYLSGFYRRARAMMMPTFFGPTNIPPLEAFACGCPAAVSDNYGMPEQADGAALLFDPRSVEEIAGAIERLWQDDDLCRELAGLGRRNAARWSQREFGAGLRAILESTAAPAHS
jgi:glycosyltransferase involved in cell wall biosynthesis